jgi:hypothetical protein
MDEKLKNGFFLAVERAVPVWPDYISSGQAGLRGGMGAIRRGKGRTMLSGVNLDPFPKK